jgi:RimJ/RimL family protein N-acetyltransferase
VSSLLWTVPLRVNADAVVRRWAQGDVAGLVSCCNDAEIARWLRFPQPYLSGHAQDFLERSESEWRVGRAYRLAITNGRGDLVGAISLRPTGGTARIGYWLAAEARGRGIATRAVETIYGWATRSFTFEEYLIFIDAQNVRSQAVARRAGFVELPDPVQQPDHGPLIAFGRSVAGMAEPPRLGGKRSEADAHDRVRG